jgi:hypothetical protein
MDLPLPDRDALSEEVFVDETGVEYRLDAKGERVYHHPEPGEDPEYDAWFIAEVEAAVREADDPNAEPSIPHEEVKREMRERWAALGIDIEKLDTA